MVENNNQEIVVIKLSAELESLEQIERLFVSNEIGNTIQLCDGNAEIKILEAGNTLSFGGGKEVELLLTFSIGVASGVIGNLIYNAICVGIKKLEINGSRTQITEENITQAIETIKNLVLLSSEKNHDSNKKNYLSDKYDEFMMQIEKSVFILNAKNTMVQGSGFILKDVGLITNYHVTENDDFYDVLTFKNENVTIVSNLTNLIRNNEKIDYACYKMNNMENWKSWECGDSANLKIGAYLIMISYPNYNNEDCPNIQNVQITGKKIFFGNEIITISGRVVHGASGGVILDEKHEVVGVINCGPATIEETDDSIIQGFIPINAIIKDINNNWHGEQEALSC